VRHLITLLFLSLLSTVFTQEYETVYSPPDSIKTRIRVIEKQSRHPLEGVLLIDENNNSLMVTDENGLAKAKTLTNLKYLTAVHKGHINTKFKLRKDPFKFKKTASVIMNPTDSLQFGNHWKDKKNNISIAINELFNCALGIRYKYQFQKKQAAGIHLSIYAKSLFPKRGEKDNYDGFKISPFYQYYLINNTKVGIYLEPKLSFGYFKANKISYSYENQTEYLTAEFWTGGAGLSIGFTNSTKKNLAIAYSVGFQYFPSGAPEYIYRNIKYEQGGSGMIWFKSWKASGPGAVIEMKLLIGFKF
jgi:hypothetical protein